MLQQKLLKPTDIPLSLYVHFPWCVRKCPYCDFNSHNLKGEPPFEAYVEALIEDFKASYPLLDRPIHSIFMGGGTPSLFSSTHIARLLDTIAQYTNLPSEITLEANPGTIEHDSFKKYKDAGITRVSLGIQSFNDAALKKIGRIHGSQEAHQAIESLIQAGFTDWNIDLMHGLPEQTVEQALQDLKAALAYQPAHLSWYQLTLEPNTAFYKQPPKLPQEDDQYEMFTQGRTLLASNDFMNYEVSAYYRTKPSMHNLNYWHFGDYLGIGAGAHSKLSTQSTIQRQVRYRHPKDYLDATKSFIKTCTDIKQEALSFEFMLNALRLSEGFILDEFRKRTGLELDCIEDTLHKAQAKDLILWQDGKLIPTELGRLYLNDLMSMFLPDEH